MLAGTDSTEPYTYAGFTLAVRIGLACNHGPNAYVLLPGAYWPKSARAHPQPAALAPMLSHLSSHTLARRPLLTERTGQGAMQATL